MLLFWLLIKMGVRQNTADNFVERHRVMVLAVIAMVVNFEKQFFILLVDGIWMGCYWRQWQQWINRYLVSFIILVIIAVLM